MILELLVCKCQDLKIWRPELLLVDMKTWGSEL
jgi:hypothetical protein